MTSVLIVEDEFLIAEDLKSSLETLGYDVIGPAPSCTAALEAIWATKPDLALVDTQLGSDTCEVVLHECVQHNIPVIICSGHIELPDFASGLPMLSKPFTNDQLVLALADWTTGREI